ncbi:phage tail length tape measure family protein [Paracoccus sp. PAR01]|uniref:phage tail length tape measure family protein n=1 Tax=Paracoccus sp. PAR01 TaxID=2769282 RepID=UPI0017833AC2|nr:phage tail length tape measure family protein [Paracoccus sp. PAR01]MBD9528378.1 phage tail length tape measure family protein [Paracoccus sp. PAR01]
MATNVGVLKATLGLDAAGFSAGIGKAKAEIGGLAKTADAAARDLRSAAGANANLVSQFNDIGVMLAAGQSPLQLALQQGTQISQVLTQMGGGTSALRAVGSAFVGMLNPVSLATIGVIGFGAAAVQWLMPAQDEAGKTKDAFDALKDSMSTYNDALSLSLLYTGESEKKYGEEALKGAEIARRIMTIEAERTRSSISGILSKAYSDMGFDAFGDRGIKGAGRIESGNVAEAALQLGLGDKTWSDTLLGYGGVSRENLALAEKLGNAMREIYDYVAQPIPEGGLDDYLVGLRQRLDDYTSQLSALKEAGADEAALNAITASMVPLQQALLEGEAKRAEIRAADAAKAEELLSTLEGQLAMNQLIAEHGKESLVVRQAELDAEFDKQAAAIEGLNITDAQKDALYDALAALHDNESQTLAWADAMAQVNAELQGAYSLISDMGGRMIMNAKVNAAQAVRDAGGSALEARRAGEIAGRKQEILNGRNTVDSQYFGMSDAEVQRQLDDIDMDAAQQDAWSALFTEPRKPGRGRKGGVARKGRAGAARQNEYQRSVADIQGETQAYLRQAEALAEVTAAGGDWERALSVIEEEQKLLTAAQKAGVEITPEVKRGITDMAEAYVDAEEKLESMRNATNRGQDAFRNLFGSVLEGADAAKEAIANLLMEIAKVQFAKGALGILGGTGWGSSLIATAGSLLSFDGGGSTGNGVRSGGLDGKGGFLAMMHPRETVIDHTKGQPAMANVHVTVGMDESGNLQVRKIAQQEAASAAGAVSKAVPAQIQQYGRNSRKR